MRVEKFYLFFDWPKSLIKKKVGDTQYGIGMIPLGGYVKIAGMIDESMDKEQMEKPAEDWEFRAKPAWQRLIVMVGGVAVNVILGILIYWMVLFTYGETYLPAENVKYGIQVEQLGQEMGLQSGDKILALDGSLPERFSQIPVNIILDDVQTITVERNGQPTDVQVPKEVKSKLAKSKGYISLRIPFEVDRTMKKSEAAKMGFEKGDQVVALNGQPIEFFDEFKSRISNMQNQNISVTVIRDGNSVELTGTVPEEGSVGIYPVGDLAKYFDLEVKNYGFFESFPKGMQKANSYASELCEADEVDLQSRGKRL